MTDIVQELWRFCDTLRHDGVDCGDYIEQITCLPFINTAADLPPPEELATDAISELDGAVGELEQVLAMLGNGNGNGRQ